MKKKALLSSLLTIALCLSLIAGSTFALFTSESTVNIAVTAGNVDVTATVDQTSIAYGSTLGTMLGETTISFSETNNEILLNKIVPGDYVKFNLVVTNASDVTVKYRTVISKVDDDGLWNGLVVTIDNESYDGVTKRTEWAELLPGSETMVIPVEISLPEQAGSAYANRSCSLAYTVEAVQGNADTDAIPDDAKDLAEILKGGDDAVLTTDTELSANDTAASNGYGKTGVFVDGGVFDGMGNELRVNDANGTWDSAVGIKGGTLKNMTISGAFRGVFMGSATADVVIDNVVIKDVVYAFNSDAGSKDYSVTIKNSTLKGWTSFSDVHKSVDFINCTFGEGSGYAFCRPYNDATFTNCTFEEGFEFDTTKASEIVFINCYYGDILITDENAATLGSGETTLFYNGLGSLKISNVES